MSFNGGKRERARDRIHQIANSVIVAIATGHIHTCNGSPGWRRVAFINMTDTSYNCPTGLSLTSYSKRTCGRSRATCTSTTFSVGGLQYSRVCGRIRGYQYGSTSAFSGSRNIESRYVDGISLTHGITGSREHMWTFAAGLTETNSSSYIGEKCPCDTSMCIVMSLHLLEMITSVRVACTLPGMASIPQMMFSGMVRVALPPAHAVSSTTLHGLQRT